MYTVHWYVLLCCGIVVMLLVPYMFGIGSRRLSLVTFMQFLWDSAYINLYMYYTHYIHAWTSLNASIVCIACLDNYMYNVSGFSLKRVRVVLHHPVVPIFPLMWLFSDLKTTILLWSFNHYHTGLKELGRTLMYAMTALSHGYNIMCSTCTVHVPYMYIEHHTCICTCYL